MSHLARPASRAAAVATLAAAAALVLTSCGDATTNGTTAGAGLDDLDGRTFVSTSIDATDHTMVPGTSIRLTFDGDEIGASAGCNQMGGQVSVDGTTLVVDNLGSTEMGCDPDLMHQDTWVAAFLTGRPTLDLAGAALTLTSAPGDAAGGDAAGGDAVGGDAAGGATIRLTEEVEEDAALEGTTWRLDSLLDGSGPEGSVSSVPMQTGEVLLRVAGGALEVTTSCGPVQAPVEVGETTLEAADLALPRDGCGDATAAVLDRLRDVLTPRASYQVDGSRLTLSADSGETGLGFVADPA